MGKKIRLVAVPDAWELTTVSAILRSLPGEERSGWADHLVLTANAATKAFHDAITSLAEAYWPWASTSNAGRLLGIPAPDPMQNSADLRERLHIDYADEVWIWRASDYTNRLVRAYPGSEAVIYDGGLNNHGPREAPPAELLPRLSRCYLMWHDYLPLPDYLTRLPLHGVNEETLLGVIRDLDESIPHTRSVSIEADTDRPRIVVLGKDYDIGQGLSVEEGLNVHRRVVTFLIDRGYTVIWKNHPKSTQDAMSALTKDSEFPEGAFVELSYDLVLPFELIVEKLNVVACVSAISNALYTSEKLFGIPAYTFQHWTGGFSTKRMRFFADLASYHFKPIEHIPVVDVTGQTLLN